MGLNFPALLNDQPVGRIALLGLLGVLAGKVWFVLPAQGALSPTAGMASPSQPAD